MQIKFYLKGLFGMFTSFGTVGVGVESKIDIGLKLALSGIGLIISLLTLASMIRDWRIKRIAAEMALCEQCRRGVRPIQCPIPMRDRPQDCPTR